MPIELDDVGLNKVAIIERSIRRALEEYERDPTLTNHTHLDAMLLNIERACQAAIDLALHEIARHRLGMPQSSTDAFRLLRKASMIDEATTIAMTAMAGFRNIAIHEYQELDISVLKAIMDGRWRSLADFCAQLGGRIEP